jgi:hypothetical protein
MRPSAQSTSSRRPRDTRRGGRSDRSQTRHLLAAARGARHLLNVSIVGVDVIPFGHYKAKLASERAAQRSSVLACRAASLAARTRRSNEISVFCSATVRASRKPFWERLATGPSSSSSARPAGVSATW